LEGNKVAITRIEVEGVVIEGDMARARTGAATGTDMDLGLVEEEVVPGEDRSHTEEGGTTPGATGVEEGAAAERELRGLGQWRRTPPLPSQ